MTAPNTAPSASSTDSEAEALESDVGETLVESNVLVEEISIDGMCGVY